MQVMDLVLVVPEILYLELAELLPLYLMLTEQLYGVLQEDLLLLIQYKQITIPC